MPIKTVGVVGCGLMGSGIVEVIAKSGYDVVVMEVNQSFLDKGLERIQMSLARAVDRKKLNAAERDATSARIRAPPTWRSSALAILWWKPQSKTWRKRRRSSRS